MRLRRRVLCLALLALVPLAAPASASAGTARLDYQCNTNRYGQSFCTAAFSYATAPGEANSVTLGRAADGAFVLSDAGAAVTAGPGCMQAGPNGASCKPDDPTPTRTIGRSARIDLGDRDDAVTSPGALVEGGPGSDRIEAPRLDYSKRTAGVSVDLRAGLGGEQGERDTLVGVKDVTGGAGADVIRGDGAANVLTGGNGSDRLFGRGGKDLLDGELGADRLDGGAGDDLLGAEEPYGSSGKRFVYTDRLVCGRGNDIVGDELPPPETEDEPDYDSPPLYSEPRDVLSGCELVALPADAPLTVLVSPRIGRRSLSLRISRRSEACVCRGRLRVTTTRGSVLAAGRTRRKRRSLTVPLTRSGRRALSGGRRVRAVVRWRWQKYRAGYTTLIRR